MNSHNDNILNKYLMFNQQTKFSQLTYNIMVSSHFHKNYKKKTCLFVFLGQCVHPVGVWQCELAFRCFGKQTKTKNKKTYTYIYIYIYFFFNVYTNNIKFLNKVLSLFLQYSSVHVPE